MSVLNIIPTKIMNDIMAAPSDGTVGEGAVLSFIGGGGKTTTIRKIAEELSSMGINVVVTTTTKILPFENPDFIVEAGDIGDNGKHQGMSLDEVLLLRSKYPGAVVLVEADGSKGCSLKGHASHEPVIPSFSDHCFMVMGLDCIGSVLNGENVHRPEIFCRLISKEIGDIIEPSDYAKIIFCERGYASKVPKGVGVSVVLTKIENVDKRAALAVCKGILSYDREMEIRIL